MAQSGVTVLVVGSGGREHALAAKLAESAKVKRVVVAPGNGGTHGGKIENSSVKTFDEIAAFCEKESVSVVVVGPEVPLADGLANFLKSRGVPCFGPSKEASVIEASKAWSKHFMRRHSIPTADYRVFTEFAEAEKYVRECGHSVVLKASGLAAGKGVVLPESVDEAVASLKDMMLDSQFGDAGKEVVVEELLVGPEVSIFAFTDGYSFVCMPPAQDHKRIFDGDKGLNTGGMGAYAPCGVPQHILKDIERRVIEPTIAGLRKEQRPFVGVLFAGLMLTKDGPKALEFNCRLGDPETQAVLPLIKSDFYDLVDACVGGYLDGVSVDFHDKSACAVVAVSEGYPKSYPKGRAITGTADANALDSVTVYHAGTKASENSGIVTSGGRVLAVTALADTMKGAVDKAYAAMGKIHFDGMHFRKDIAHQMLNKPSDDAKSAPEEAKSLTYADAGVDIEVGDEASRSAYAYAKSTFSGRSGLIGEPVVDDGGFAGLLDMGDFYLVQGDDGVGTKIQVAEWLNKYDTLGADLLAMVCDDAICVGAETVSITNTVDTNRVNKEQIASMMKGLAAACLEQNIVIPGGEIAELGSEVRSTVWNATAVGVVAKDRVIGRETIAPGDLVIACREDGFRSNGFSLVRYILEQRFGAGVRREAFLATKMLNSEATFGEAILTPSKIYSKAILSLIGRFSERNSAPPVQVKGICHVTGGGIPGNLSRVLKKHNVGASLNSLFPPSPVMAELRRLGKVAAKEAFTTWNMGNGMLIVVPNDAEAAAKAVALLASAGVEARVAGSVQSDAKIEIVHEGETLAFDVC